MTRTTAEQHADTAVRIAARVAMEVRSGATIERAVRTVADSFAAHTGCTTAEADFAVTYAVHAVNTAARRA